MSQFLFSFLEEMDGSIFIYVAYDLQKYHKIGY